MNTSLMLTTRSVWLASFVLVTVVGTARVQAEDLKVEARLIWGTNDAKSGNKKHKPIDGPTAEKLREVFKWKNYFVETTHNVTVMSRQSKTLEMSADCKIEIRELPSEPIEVKLIGKGKLVNKTTKPLRKGELFIIGGDDENKCAWFVLIEKK